MTHAKRDKLRRYKIALSINVTVWILQFITVIFIANSLALFGDMTHSLSDIFIIAGTTFVIAREIKNPLHGHAMAKRILVIFAVGLLWISATYVSIEAFERIQHPIGFPGWPVAILALFSAIGNFTAHRVIQGVEVAEHDHVHEANVAHLLADFALSFVVLISALGNIIWGLPAIDAWISLIIVAPWMFRWGWKIIHPAPHTHHHHH